MKLKHAPDSNVAVDERVAFRDRPVDLAHLSRYTKGNSVSEREVLDLFRRQVRIHFDKLTNAADDAAWRDAAHVLKTAARSVGAWQIFHTAENAEQIAAVPAPGVRDALIATLKEQISDANAFIEKALA